MQYQDRTRVVAVQLPDGGWMRAEVVGSSGGDVSDASRPFDLNDLRNTIAGVGRWAANTVRAGLPRRPDSVEVEFGFKLGVEAGRLIGILAKGTGEGAIIVRLGWQGDTAERRPADDIGDGDPAIPSGEPTEGAERAG